MYPMKRALIACCVLHRRGRSVPEDVTAAERHAMYVATDPLGPLGSGSTTGEARTRTQHL